MNVLTAIEKIYAGSRIISLDVAAAALGGGILASKVIGATPRTSFYWLLPAGVWVAYTIDHLLDARRMGPNARTPRHRFHYHHAHQLRICAAVLSIVCAVGGWMTLSWFGLIYAGVMCGLVIAHETIIKLAGNRASPLLFKELGVALVFTAGVWGMPWLRHYLNTRHILGWPVVLLFQYFLLAVVNLIEFSIYESKIDTADGQTSFVRAIGRQTARRIVLVLLVFQMPLGLLSLWQDPTDVVLVSELIYLLMCIGLGLIILAPKVMVHNERYRTLGDGVFLLPLVLMFLDN